MFFVRSKMMGLALPPYLTLCEHNRRLEERLLYFIKTFCVLLRKLVVIYLPINKKI